MPKLKDTDYLFITAAVRARENKLLDREKIERMLSARTPQDAEKIAEECGYENIAELSGDELDEALSAKFTAELDDLSKQAPDKALVDVFRLQYDYHNVKTLVKSEAAGTNADRLLLSSGSIPTGKLKEAFDKGEFKELGEIIAPAIEEARESMARTKDPQIADFVLDKAYFAQMTSKAKDFNSPFLQGYVKVLIDAANLRSTIRAVRMNKSPAFVKDILVSGGNIEPDSIIDACAGDKLSELYSSTVFREAAAEGEQAMTGGRLTGFERLCDNAVMKYLAGAKLVSFGEQPLAAYIYALQNEVSVIRIIISGLRSGIEPEVIRERLREVW